MPHQRESEKANGEHAVKPCESMLQLASIVFVLMVNSQDYADVMDIVSHMTIHVS